MSESVEYENGSMYLDPVDAGRFHSMKEQIAALTAERDALQAKVDRLSARGIEEQAKGLGIVGRRP